MNRGLSFSSGNLSVTVVARRERVSVFSVFSAYSVDNIKIKFG